MGILDIGRPKYTASAKCNNCNQKTDVVILKGHTIKEWMSKGRGKCEHCGCIIKSIDDDDA